MLIWCWLCLWIIPVVGHTPHYDAVWASQMMRYAYASYCSATAIQLWTCRPWCAGAPGLQDLHVVQSRGNQTLGYVGFAHTPQPQIVISFRGTVNENIENWILDFTAKLKHPWAAFPRVGVHSGFYEAWQSLSPGIFAATKKLYMANAHRPLVTVTGHSLGAAMAALCAFELHHFEGIKVLSLMTLGQPRTGNKEFAALYDSFGISTWRLTHNRDPVPQLPPIGMRYSHIANEVFYDEDNSIYVVCHEGEATNCQGGVAFADWPSDHTTYLNASGGGGSCL